MKPNTNPSCPICGSATSKHDTTAANSQRYRCNDKTCRKKFVEQPQKPGPKPTGKADSGATRFKRWYDSLSDEERAEYNRKKNEGRSRKKKSDS